MIRRVKIHEIIFASRGFPEILALNINTLQGNVTGLQVVFLINARLFRAADRDVKFALAVDAPQAVKTGFVEVNKSGGFFYRVLQIMLFSGAVIIVAAVLSSVFAQLVNQRVGIALDDLIRGDEIAVDVT